MKLLITSAYHRVDQNQYSFFVVDSETEQTIAKVPCTDLLDQRPSNSDYAQNQLTFNPFGITNGEGKIFVASNYVIQAFDQETLEPLEVVSTSGVPNVHEILYHNGYIYRTNTSNDTLTRINLSTKEEIHFSFKTMGRVDSYVVPDTHEEVLAMDTMHINSVAIYDGKVYALSHSRGNVRSEVFSLDLDLTSAEKFCNLDYQNHGLLFDNGKLYSLGTQKGYLVTVDLETKAVKKKYVYNPHAFFLRGLIKLNGEVKMVANQRLKITLERPERIRGYKEMLATNPDNLKALHFVTINPETLVSTYTELEDFGVIQDINILN
jgi:hypothetical protein